MHVCSVCVGACLFGVQPPDAAQVRGCKPLNVPVCACACECLLCPPALVAVRSPNLPPALTFQLSARRSCYVWYFSCRRGNGKQWPRLPGEPAVVATEQQHGRFPQCRNSAQSPTRIHFCDFLPFCPPSVSLSSTQVLPSRHYPIEIRQDQK